MNYLTIGINIIFLTIFIASLWKTIQLITVFFNKERHLTELGHKNLGLALTGLILSGLQVFQIYDFIKFIIQ